MAEGKDRARGAAETSDTVRDQVRESSGVDRLKEELQSYAQTRLELMVSDMGHRLGEAAGRLGSAHTPHLGAKELVGVAAKGGKALGGGGSVLGKTAAHAKDVLLDKAKEGAKKQGGTTDTGKSLTIIEDIDIGVPVREAYNQWTQFQEFGRFAKGVVGVDQEDDTTTQWQVKIAKASRHWQGTITEQVPDQRIAWTSEAAKGTTKGVVTFHSLADNLTKVLLVLQYFPKGVVEKTGGLVRAQGRRTRLDLKLFRTFVMMRGEATGGWRGEIRDGEVVRGDDEPEEPEDAEGGEEAGEDEAYDDRDEEAARDADRDDEELYEDEDEDEAEDRAEDEDEYDDEGEDGEDGEDEARDDEDDEDDGYDDEEDDRDEEPYDDEEPEPLDERPRRR